MKENTGRPLIWEFYPVTDKNQTPKKPKKSCDMLPKIQKKFV
jgi:hypothetical protein